MSESIRTLIADDEPLARRMLRVMLERRPDFEIIAEVSNGHELAEAIRTSQPELLVLDIRMPFLSGIEVLQRLPFPAQTIFVTAHAEHALQAFDVDAVDYILKPYDDARLWRALDKAKHAIWSRRLQAQAGGEGGQGSDLERIEPTRVAVCEGRRTKWIEAHEIVWVEAADYYTHIHTAHRSYLARHTLLSFERQLSGDQFLRVHRGALVNVRHVRAFDRGAGGQLILSLSTGQEICVSRSRRREVASQLKRLGALRQI